ncbi:MAG: hypothetical protein ACTSRI_07290 [Promethearchaeota archaeon]
MLSGRTSLLIKEARDELRKLSEYDEDKKKYINPLNLEEPVYFSKDNDELNSGKEIFEITSKLIGHFTLRLIFLHMIDFYSEKSKGIVEKYHFDVIQILKHKDIAKYLRQFYIITPTQQYNIPLSGAESLKKHKFSLFFLDSRIYLPIKDIYDEYNQVSFGNIPLSFITHKIEADTLKELYRKVSNNFYGNYYSQFHYLLSRVGKESRMELFKKSGLEIMSVLKKEIKSYVDGLHLPRNKKIELENELLTNAEKEIFSYYQYILKDKSHVPNLRTQIENLLIGKEKMNIFDIYYTYNLDSNKFEAEIEFHKVYIERRDKEGNIVRDEKGNIVRDTVKIRMNKDDFKGKNIKIVRGTEFSEEDLRHKFKEANSDVIKNKVDILVKTIEHLNKKVKIYPIIPYTKKDHTKFGYQYILRDDMFPFIPLKASDSGDPRHFEIDLTKKETRKAGIEKLKRIAALSSCYRSVSGRYIPTTNTKFLFVMTSDNVHTSEYGVPNPDVQIDCIFDGKRFYDGTDIFSRDVGDEDRYLHLCIPASPLKKLTLGLGSRYGTKWKNSGPTFPIDIKKAFPESDPSSWWY